MVKNSLSKFQYLLLFYRRALSVIYSVFIMVFIATTPALGAWNATTQATGVLKFIALVILIAAGIGALQMLVSGQIMQAIVIVICASLLYFLLGNTTAIQGIGDGINNLLFGGGSSGTETQGDA